MTNDWRELDPENWVIAAPTPEHHLDNLAYTDRYAHPTPLIYARGKRMRRGQAMLDELGAALQFPEYVGSGWPSADEALCDLEWLGEEGLLLVITSAGQLLADAPEDGPDFADLLITARQSWRHPVEQETLRTEPKPFTVVFEDSPEELTALAARLVGLPLHLP